MTRLPADVIALQGATGRALMRRLHDARFATRYFVGAGIDVGSGYDSLSSYMTFFPLITSVLSWDLPQGDGQKLEGVPDGAFDFLYSSHCLEHLGNVSAALRRWIEVVRPGGHLVIVVPDEDLYEQGVWPSMFNPDHQASFTTKMGMSWAPASCNLLALLWQDGVRVLKIERLDHAYFPELGTQLDQTRAAYGESALEIILRREA